MARIIRLERTGYKDTRKNANKKAPNNLEDNENVSEGETSEIPSKIKGVTGRACHGVSRGMYLAGTVYE